MRYQDGFHLNSPLNPSGVVWMEASNVSIAAGDALFISSGYIVNNVTAFAVGTFMGVAACDVDNSGGSAGDLKVPVILPLPELLFWVPNESSTVLAAAYQGAAYDLESNDGIDITDTTLVGWGFHVLDYDISTKAVAAKTGGYALGRFVLKGAS